MPEEIFERRTIKIQIAFLISSVVSLVWVGFITAQFYFDHDSRIARLEEFSNEGSRYTATDASRDLLLRDQRMDSIEEKLDSGVSDIKNSLDKIDKKLDLLFVPKK